MQLLLQQQQQAAVLQAMLRSSKQLLGRTLQSQMTAQALKMMTAGLQEQASLLQHYRTAAGPEAGEESGAQRQLL
jgi:hypothetical protein